MAANRITAIACAVGFAAAVLVAPTNAAAQAPCRNVAIRSPFSGEQVSGVVPILGSARIDSFLFYKLEYASAEQPEEWAAVSTTIPDVVLNGLLDSWDTTVLPDGSYRLKLTLVDQASQEPCRVTVNNLSVANGPGPTPSATATAPTVVARAGARATAPPSGAASESIPAPPDTSAGQAAAPDSAVSGSPVSETEAASTPSAEADDEAVVLETDADADADADSDADAEAEAADVDSAATEPDQPGTDDGGDGGDGDDASGTDGADEAGDVDGADDAADTDEAGDANGADEGDADASSPEEAAGPELFPQPSTLANAVGATSWPLAFCGGIVAMVLLLLFAAAALALRRSS